MLNIDQIAEDVQKDFQRKGKEVEVSLQSWDAFSASGEKSCVVINLASCEATNPEQYPKGLIHELSGDNKNKVIGIRNQFCDVYVNALHEKFSCNNSPLWYSEGQKKTLALYDSLISSLKKATNGNLGWTGGSWLKVYNEATLKFQINFLVPIFEE